MKRHRHRIYSLIRTFALSFALILFGHIQIAWSQTQVFSINVSPNPFNPVTGNATITVQATPATANLEVHVFDANDSLVRSELDLTEISSGTYSTLWDGRSNNGRTVLGGQYSFRVFNEATTTYLASQSGIATVDAVTAVSSSFNPFIPTGDNFTTITVQATPGQTGLSLQISGPGGTWCFSDFSSCQLPLVETSPGTYTAQWSAVGRSCCSFGNPINIFRDGTYTVNVFDSVFHLLATGSVTVTGVNQVMVAPQPLKPGGGNFTTITVNGAPGLGLDARIINAVTNVTTTILPLSEASGIYTAEWNGTDLSGNFAGANTYRVQIFNRDSGQRYQPETSIVVEAGVFSILASPDPFVPTGNNLATLTVRADSGLSGLTASITSPQGQSISGISLVETGSVGTYLGSWDGKINGTIPADGVYTTRVFDASGNTFPTTGSLTLSSARSFAMNPNSFEPGTGRTAAITAEVASGLQLEARIGSNVVIPLTASGNTYSATWDGRDNSGFPLAAGAYTMFLFNSTPLCQDRCRMREQMESGARERKRK